MSVDGHEIPLENNGNYIDPVRLSATVYPYVLGYSLKRRLLLSVLVFLTQINKVLGREI